VVDRKREAATSGWSFDAGRNPNEDAKKPIAVERTRKAAKRTWSEIQRRPIQAVIALLVIAGGITTALIAGAQSPAPYSGCGYGYSGSGDTGYAYGYGSCPPPPTTTTTSLLTSSMSATSSTPGGSATATNDGTTVTASGGEGTVTVGQYSADPVGALSSGGTNEYLDVSVSTGNTFTSVTIVDSNLNGGDTLMWWNGNNWEQVVGDPGPTYSAGPPPSVTLTLNNSTALTGEPHATTPTLAELTGTVFAVTTASAPSAPTGLNTIPGNAQAGFNWSSPSSDGGSAVLSYTVTCSPSGSVTVTTMSATISGLTNGTTYSCTVAATNAAGTGQPSSSAKVTPSLSVPPPPPPSACASYSGNQAFVCVVYEDLLSRAPDAAGLASWTSALAGGTSQSQVAYGIASSNEYRTDLVQGYYERFLNRAGDPAGVSSWVAAMGSGWTDEQVISGIVGSAEFYTAAGSTTNGFISAVYEDLLGRSPDSAGLANWSSALAGGTSQSQVAYGIASSNEYRTDLVQGYYEHFLNRAADSAGVSSWVAAMGSGWTDEQVISGIVGSAEFYTDSTT
jgi:hypothetical protein